MNVRKSVDYSDMFKAMDALIASNLPQMELYCGIGRLVSGRPEKGAAVAAAEYLNSTYPDVSGFSPRNLRRMREFYRTYENTPGVLVQAMTIGWIQNIVILENCAYVEECIWYIAAVRRFHWSKAELLEKITKRTHGDSTLSLCCTEAAEEEASLSNIDISNTATRTLSNRESHSAPLACVGCDAGGRSENGLYQGHEDCPAQHRFPWILACAPPEALQPGEDDPPHLHPLSRAQPPPRCRPDRRIHPYDGTLRVGELASKVNLSKNQQSRNP